MTLVTYLAFSFAAAIDVLLVSAGLTISRNYCDTHSNNSRFCSFTLPRVFPRR